MNRHFSWASKPITWGTFFKFAGIFTAIGTAISGFWCLWLIEPAWWVATKDFVRSVITMTYKQIEASRELRLWIGQIIIPAISVSAILLANPDIRRVAAEKVEEVKQKFHSKKNGAAW